MTVKALIELLERIDERELQKEIVASFMGDAADLEGFPITSRVRAPPETGKVYLEIEANLDRRECFQKECSYYRHYLLYYDRERNGEKLEHAAFHHAETKCEIAQKRYLEWLDNEENAGKTIPEHLERQADFWEKKICA